MTGKLTVGADGHVTGPANIKYNSPFPCVNGAFETGAMMGVVMHTMAGNLPGTIGVFNDPAKQASAHFGIAQDGEIWQFGPIGKGWAAWHAVAANRSWYGIEHADDGNPRNPLTAAQITASAQLVELLSRFAGFPLQVTDSPSVKGYGTHVMGGPAWNPDGHTCPGPGPRAGQRAQIIALAMSIRSGPGGLKTWTARGQLSLHDLAAADLHQDAAAILALTARHSAGAVFAKPLAQYIDTVFAGDSSRCPAGVTWHYPGKGGMAATWTTKGELSLSALASELGTRPSVVLQMTADVAAGFSPAAAGYIDAVSAGSALHLPAGTVLYYGSAS